MKTWCLRALVLTAGLTVTLFAALLLLPNHLYRSALVTAVASFTSFELNVDTLALTRELSPTLQLSNVSLTRKKNNEDTKEPLIIQVDELTAQLRIMSLFKRTIHVPLLAGQRIDAVVAGGGNTNLRELFSKLSLPFDIIIDTLDVDEFSLRYSSKNDNTMNVNSASDNTINVLVSALDASVNTVAPSLLASVQGTVNGVPATIDADINDQDNAVNAINNSSFNVGASVANLDFTMRGTTDTLSDQLTTQARIDMLLDSTEDLGNQLGLALPPVGRIAATTHVSVELGRPLTSASLTNLDVAINGPIADIQVEGDIAQVLTDPQLDLNVQAATQSLENLLAQFQSPKTLPGEVSINANITGSSRALDVEIPSAVLTSPNLAVSVAGNVIDALGSADATIQLQVDTPNLDVVTDLFGVGMPEGWGPIKATGLLRGANKQYAISDIDASFNNESTARATGEIAQLYPFDGLHLDADFSLHTLAEISAITPKPLPDIGPFNGTGIVGWSDGRLFLEDARATYSGIFGSALVTGNIGDLIGFDKVRLRADIDAPGFEALELFTGVTFPAVDRVTASTNIISDTPRDFSAKNLSIDAQLDDIIVQAQGRVSSILKQRAVLDLHVSTSLNSLTQLNSTVQQQLPPLGPISASATVSGQGRNIALSDVHVDIRDPHLSGTISADPGPLADFTGTSAAFSFETSSLKGALDRFNIISNLDLPSSLTGALTLDTHDLSFNNVWLTLPSTRIGADLKLDGVLDKGKSTKLSGKINVPTFDVFELTGTDPRNAGGEASEPEQPTGDAQAQQAKAEPSATATSIWSADTALPFRRLAAIDTDLEISIGKLRSRLLEIENASLSVGVKDRVFTAGPINGTVNEGKTFLNLVADTQQEETRVSLDLSVDNFNLARAGLVADSDLIESQGGTYARLTVTGVGETLRQLMASSNGEGGVYIENLLLRQGLLDVLSSDLLTQLAEAVNPFDKKPSVTYINCAAGIFSLSNGKLQTRHPVALEADEYVVIGNGNLQLTNSAVNLEFSTKAKKGFGLSLKRITNLVEVKGTLQKPQLSLNESQLIGLSASIAASVATGGVSLIAEGLLDRYEANSGVCKRALGQ